MGETGVVRFCFRAGCGREQARLLIQDTAEELWVDFGLLPFLLPLPVYDVMFGKREIVWYVG